MTTKQPPDSKYSSELEKALEAYKAAVIHEHRFPDDVGTRLTKLAAQNFTNLLRRVEVASVYGFHEYIMGKNIIREETDQAFNYARLHHAIDEYAKELEKEQ